MFKKFLIDTFSLYFYYQLFWEKRLQGLRASDMDEEAFNNFELPRNMKGNALNKQLYGAVEFTF